MKRKLDRIVCIILYILGFIVIGQVLLSGDVKEISYLISNYLVSKYNAIILFITLVSIPILLLIHLKLESEIEKDDKDKLEEDTNS